MPESVYTLNSSSGLCSRLDANEVLEQDRSLTEDKVLACGKSRTLPKVLGSLTAKVECDLSELTRCEGHNFRFPSRGLSSTSALTETSDDVLKS